MLISFVWLYMFKCDVYARILVDQTQKDFWVFYLFLKVICTYSNVMCMLKYLLIKPKNIFECFIRFWKWFYTFMSYVFIQNAFLCFSSKSGFRGCLARSLRLRASHEKGLRVINFFILSHRNSRYCIVTTSLPTATRKMLFG